MNQSQGSDAILKRKKIEVDDYEYYPNKKVLRLGGDEEDRKESERSNEPQITKCLKQGSSSEKNFAKKYLLKHGYKEGSGLGKYQNGIVQPVEASNQRGRRGLGFEPADLKDAISKYDPSLEEVSLDEEVSWLVNDYSDSISRECLESWLKIGPAKPCISENSRFCDSHILKNILSSKNVLDSITDKDLENGRRRSNPFESIQNAIFLNRAAVKMANLDAILGRMFTEPTDTEGKAVIGPNELLYFADVCAGPGGFSEYVLFRKKWRAKGFGFTLRNHNDFALEQFGAGPPESFEPHYGAREDGDVFVPENITSFKEHVLKYTEQKGVHFMMADGGVEITDKFNDQELICKKLYLCQCLVALHIVRAEGHFVVKLFDLFTEFSVGLLYLMYRSFRQVSIIKPNSSRPANSERYLVCKWKREDCSDIADFLFDMNKRVPLYEERSQADVVEVVPTEVLMEDEKFFEYIRTSNNRLGRRQFVSLQKLAAFSEDVNLKEERQQELRKACLRKWNVPDEARADPKKCESRTKWIDLLGSSPLSELDTKKNKIESFESFKEKIRSKYSWYGMVVSGEESNSTCALYLGLGRNNVQKYECGKWVKPNSANLCLPAKTVVYGETVYEYLGEGRGQRKIFAFHIIDALFLGGEDVRDLPFRERVNLYGTKDEEGARTGSTCLTQIGRLVVKTSNCHIPWPSGSDEPTERPLLELNVFPIICVPLEMCRLFAKSLYKETFPVRVKDHYPLAETNSLWEQLVLKYTKSSNVQSLCVPLESSSFYKAGGIIFIRDTREYWDRYFSNSFRKFYLFHRKKNDRIYEEEVKDNFWKECYGDFMFCFQTRLIWWWGEGVVVHESQTFDPDPTKMQRIDITAFVNTT